MILTVMLLAWPALSRARNFQPVAKISCPNGEFVVYARPFDPNEAGSSAVDIRYRYRGIDLAAIDYERYYNNLSPYLRDENAVVRDLGLHLDTSGLPRYAYAGDYDRGDTLYLPPASFQPSDFDSLAECIAHQQAALRDSFARADISGSYFLGLLKTHVGIARTGVARLVYGEAPLVSIYGSTWYVILVARTGRVLIHTTYTSNNASEAVLLGQVVTSGRGKRSIQAPSTVQLAGQTIQTKLLRSEKDRHGRTLGDDYEIVTP